MDQRTFERSTENTFTFPGTIVHTMEPTRDCVKLVEELNTALRGRDPTHNWTYLAKLIHSNENHQRDMKDLNSMGGFEETWHNTRNGCILAQWTHLLLHTKDESLAQSFKHAMLTVFEDVLMRKYDAWTASHTMVTEWLQSEVFSSTYAWVNDVRDLWSGSITFSQFRKVCAQL